MTLSDALSRIAEAIRKTALSHPLSPLLPSELEKAAGAYFSRGGKLIRPALCLLSAAALGGEEAARRALVPALSAEYFHLFTLVHDDVIDHDTLRRGEKTAHLLAAEHSGIAAEKAAAEYGTAAAILAGDALFGRAVALVAKDSGLSPSCRLLLLEKLTDSTLPALLSGEALDTKLAYLSSCIPDEKTLSAVYRSKTGVLFEYALFAGALAALEKEPEQALCRAIGEAGAHIGEAFQLTDDYLGLTAAEATLGKNTLSDIREGKRTYFVRFAYEKADPREAALLSRTLGNAHAPQKDVEAVRTLLLSKAEKEYLSRIQTAEERTRRLLDFLPDNDAKELLFSLFSFMIRRKS